MHSGERYCVVIVLPSPFNWTFTLTASRSALPGVTDEDAVDIYNAMKATLSAVREQHESTVTRHGAVGFSLCALQHDWIAEADRIDGSVGLERFLLVNPPIDLAYDAQRIEELSDAGAAISPRVRQRLISYAFESVLEAWQGDINDPGYLTDLDRRFKVNDVGRKFLIGYAMQLALDDVISASELLNHQGIVDVPSPLATSLLGDAKDQSYTFDRYLNEVLLPVWTERLDVDDPLPVLKARADLLPFLDRLGSNPYVHLMHNRDDFIVIHAHLLRVAAAFGDRAIIYPAGGHLGNLWFPPNRARLLEMFADLPQSLLQEILVLLQFGWSPRDRRVSCRNAEGIVGISSDLNPTFSIPEECRRIRHARPGRRLRLPEPKSQPL